MISESARYERASTGVRGSPLKAVVDTSLVCSLGSNLGNSQAKIGYAKGALNDAGYVNQFLHRLMGRCRIVVKDSQVNGKANAP